MPALTARRMFRSLPATGALLAGLVLLGGIAEGSAMGNPAAAPHPPATSGKPSISTFTSNASGNCSTAQVPFAPHFNARSGVAHMRVRASLQVSPTCATNLTSASAIAVLNLSIPVAVTSSTHSVLLTVSGTYEASEWAKRTAPCPKAYGKGCSVISAFGLGASVLLFDNTSKTGYCDTNSSFRGSAALPVPIGCGDVVTAFHQICPPSYLNQYFCHPASRNLRTSGSFSTTFNITNQTVCGWLLGSALGCYYLGGPAFTSADQYELILSISAQCWVTDYGWPAVSAYASADLAGDDHVTVGPVTLR